MDGNEQRLLPWAVEGRPCYLRGEAGGFMSRVADEMEEAQLATAAVVLGHAKTVLENRASPPVEVRNSALRLAESLTDLLRVAESRGVRLPHPEASRAAGERVSTLRAEAFG